MLQRSGSPSNSAKNVGAQGLSVEVDQLKGMQLRQLTKSATRSTSCSTMPSSNCKIKPVAIGGSAVESVDGEELANLQGKYDMAMTDLRELRRRNAELETRIAQSVQASSARRPWIGKVRRSGCSRRSRPRSATRNRSRSSR